MEKKLFTLSEDATKEYSASIVKIGELLPIEGSDFLVKTVVDGFDIVVRKDEVKTGDVMVYCRIETTLDSGFLSKNNLYELCERERNSNYKEVEELLNSGKEDEAKRKVGFFNKHGRVKIIKLRKCPSMGFLFSKDSLMKWKPSLFENVNLEDYIDIPYWDTINGNKFCEMYVPNLPEPKQMSRRVKGNKKLKRFDILIPGQFSFHYDTQPLNKEMWRFSPDTNVSISVKLHGTSLCMGNVLCNLPIKNNKLFPLVYKKRIADAIKRNKFFMADQLKKKMKTTTEKKYAVVYSSRKVIKNQYINPLVTSGYYDKDVWVDYYKILKNYIPEGYEIFGEIIGYTGEGDKMIQKDYDYGCPKGTNKLMVYRITKLNPETGEKTELSISEVYKWTTSLVKNHPEIKKYIHPIDILYQGPLGKLYPQIDVNQDMRDWRDKVLEAMKNDLQGFGMEAQEPLCKTKVPREGIVIRIDDDPVAEAFKLKAAAFLFKESEAINKGEVDIEMQNNM